MTIETFVSYAQNGEDVILWRALGNVRDGRYVDVGAADPEVDSVTKAFVDRGWRGIDVEPVPQYAERLREARPLNEVVQAAITDEAVGELVLHVFEGTGLSTVGDKVAKGVSWTSAEEVVVPARSLDDVCASSGLLTGELHFLKIDVEGSEVSVLRSFSLDKWRPWVVVMESTLPNSSIQSFERWDALLVDAGYVFALFDGLNRYYVSPDHRELQEPLSYPACVLDRYEKVAHVRLAQQSQIALTELSRWRNMAIGGFAESAAVAQAAVANEVNLRKKARRLDRQLEVTRDKLFAVRKANQSFRAKLARLESHLEVRIRRRAGRIARRARGRS